MVRRRGTPSQTWRSFLRNHDEHIDRSDAFGVASAAFRLLYVMVILGHDRRKIVRTAVAEHPTAALAVAPADRSVPVGHCSALSAARSRRGIWLLLLQPGRGDRHQASHYGTTITLAERLRRARDRVDPSRMYRPHRDLQRAPSAPRPVLVCRLLPTHSHASVARQGLPRFTPDHATQDRKGGRHPAGEQRHAYQNRVNEGQFAENTVPHPLKSLPFTHFVQVKTLRPEA